MSSNLELSGVHLPGFLLRPGKFQISDRASSFRADLTTYGLLFDSIDFGSFAWPLDPEVLSNHPIYLQPVSWIVSVTLLRLRRLVLRASIKSMLT